MLTATCQSHIGNNMMCCNAVLSYSLFSIFAFPTIIELMEYKGVKYAVYPEWSAVALESYTDFPDDIERVLYASKFAELLGYIKPKNVIVDERHGTRPPAYFMDFLEKRLFRDSIDYGVERIFYILPEEEYQFANANLPNKPDYLFFCTSLEEVFRIIEKS
jgi:hypothetical protein